MNRIIEWGKARQQRGLPQLQLPADLNTGSSAMLPADLADNIKVLAFPPAGVKREQIHDEARAGAGTAGAGEALAPATDEDFNLEELPPALTDAQVAAQDAFESTEAPPSFGYTGLGAENLAGVNEGPASAPAPATTAAKAEAEVAVVASDAVTPATQAAGQPATEPATSAAEAVAKSGNESAAKKSSGRKSSKRQPRDTSYLLEAEYQKYCLHDFLGCTPEQAIRFLARVRWREFNKEFFDHHDALAKADDERRAAARAQAALEGGGKGKVRPITPTWSAQAELTSDIPVRQVCPHCGDIDSHYWCQSHMGWKCRSCRTKFTILSGTPLHSLKVDPRELLGRCFGFVEGKDSISAREVSGLYKHNHQSVFVSTLKIREAIRVTMLKEPPLEGVIQADAAYFAKYVRPENGGNPAARRNKSASQAAGITGPTDAAGVSPNYRAVVVFVEVGPQTKRRYRVATLKSENQIELFQLGQAHCSPGSTLLTDEHPGYNPLSGYVAEHRTVNHSKEFMAEDGTHTNLAENFFSRMRAAQKGAWHKQTAQHLEFYAWEMAWRMQMVGYNNRHQLMDLVNRILSTGRAEEFRDYWNHTGTKPKRAPEETGTLVEVHKSKVPKKTGRPAATTLKKAEAPPAPPKRAYNKKPTGNTAATGAEKPCQSAVPEAAATDAAAANCEAHGALTQAQGQADAPTDEGPAAAAC